MPSFQGLSSPLSDDKETSGSAISTKEAGAYGVSEGDRSYRRKLAALSERIYELESALVRKEGTISFQLGKTLLDGLKSLSSAVRLPVALWRIHKYAEERKNLSKQSKGLLGQAKQFELAVQFAVINEDVSGLPSLGAEKLAPEIVVEICFRIARCYFAGFPEASTALIDYAMSIGNPDVRSGFWTASTLDAAGNVTTACQIINAIQADLHELNDVQRLRARRILALQQTQQLIASLPPPTHDVLAEAAEANQRWKVGYFLHCSYPFHANGYSRRSEALCRSLIALGVDVLCYTRLGYPEDRDDAIKDGNPPLPHEFNGYRRMPLRDSRRLTAADYITRSRDEILAVIRQENLNLVQAPSNYVNALPALLAAREARVPFVYEVRGLWELTAVSRIPSFETTEKFSCMKDLELSIAQSADLVLAISATLRDELVSRGCDGAKIRVVENGVFLQDFPVLNEESTNRKKLGISENTFVVGFLGSVVGYEGLNLLVAAIRKLVIRGLDVALIVVGDGNDRAAVQHAIAQFPADVANAFRLVGRVPPDRVREYYSLFDLAAYPRLPEMVCRIVPALKPLEAMSMGIPVLISNVPALKELCGDSVYSFIAGDVEDLAEKIAHVSMNSADAKARAITGREFVALRRDWPIIASQMIKAWGTLRARNSNCEDYP
ncbi:glycosyltransferase family 4 protein [Achromobacter sp. NPDC008082]|uniref:glycosyltransferase family 4 protein n=1 Tax=Achromobacter sp. NPDC008082 TaxID=3363888 RepID=UPI0036E8D2A5